MNRFVVFLASNGIEVAIHLVHVERSNRRSNLCYGYQASIKCLVSRNLVLVVLAAPVALSAETNIPVAQVVHHESLNQTACLCIFVSFVSLADFLNQSVQQAENPAVEFGTLLERNIGFCVGEVVGICVHCKEIVCIVQSSEEFALNLVNSGNVELEVVPSLCIGNHIPANRVGTIFVDSFERIYSIAKSLRHLIAVLVEYQTVGNDVLVCYAVENHCCNCVQGEEPTACLVNAFSDEVSWEQLVEAVFVLERIMPLCVRHCTRIEPNIDKVWFAEHLTTIRCNKHNLVNIRTMQVKVFVVFLGVFANLEVLPRIFLHISLGD